jgi:hypothetical protein
MTILPAFLRLPQEAAIIGRLLAGYGELEFEFADCVKHFSHDMHSAFAALFRLRTESGRIQVADALIRGPITALGLGTQYKDAYDAMLHCLKIRNQYAHCHWLEQDGELLFTMLDHAFDGPETKSLTIRVALLSTLQAQETYFDYTRRCFWFLSHETQRLRGQLRDNPFSMPLRMQPAILHTPPTKPLPRTAV